MSIQNKDSKVARIIAGEEKRQTDHLELIPSENYASAEVLEALGSVLTNKYSEGKPHARYYGGQEFVDQIEDLAVARALKMFGLSSRDWHANIQPYSGSPANMAIYLALAEPGDKIMGMKLTEGGHLTHGHPVNFSGRLFKVAQYSVNQETGLINYDEVEKIAVREKPKIIICGATAYSRLLDFEEFARIAKKVRAYLVADISHIAGLIVGGVHPSPFPHADAVMTTTHKTLRGPRGAIIICKKDLAEKIDRAVFPGLQGGPHENTIAAIAICFGEALKPEFKKYAEQVVKNAKVLADTLSRNNLKVISGGTDNHLMLVDVTSVGITGKEAEKLLEKSSIVVNKNTIPGDKNPPTIGSGIRLGTPAVTSRGMKEAEMKIIGELISNALRKSTLRRAQGCPEYSRRAKNFQDIKNQVRKLTKKFKVPGIS